MTTLGSPNWSRGKFSKNSPGRPMMDHMAPTRQFTTCHSAALGAQGPWGWALWLILPPAYLYPGAPGVIKNTPWAPVVIKKNQGPGGHEKLPLGPPGFAEPSTPSTPFTPFTPLATSDTLQGRHRIYPGPQGCAPGAQNSPRSSWGVPEISPSPLPQGGLPAQFTYREM